MNMEPTEIRQIANGGSNKEVTQLYKRIFGRDISGCKSCQKTDARFFLNRYATQLELGNMSTYKVKPEFSGWQSITGVGPIYPLDDLKVVAIEAAGFGYILEPIADALGVEVEPGQVELTEPSEATTPDTEPDTASDTEPDPDTDHEQES